MVRVLILSVFKTLEKCGPPGPSLGTEKGTHPRVFIPENTKGVRLSPQGAGFARAPSVLASAHEERKGE